MPVRGEYPDGWYSYKKLTDLQKTSNWNCSKWVFLFSFLNFTFGCHGFHLKHWVENISIWFLSWCAEENLAVNNKANRVFMYRNLIGLIATPWKCDVIKTSVYAFFNKYIPKRTSNFLGAPISRQLSSTETIYCLATTSSDVTFMLQIFLFVSITGLNL